MLSEATAPPSAALVLLDCRTQLNAPHVGREAWESGHIPGAQYASLDTQLAAAAHSQGTSGGGRHPLPPRAQLVEQCSAWGISADTQVVAYDDAGGAFAARAWWLLRWLGHTKVAVLNGGIQAWQAQPNTVLESTLDESADSPQRGQFEDRMSLTRLAQLGEIESLVKSGITSPQLIDARAEPRFKGEMEPIDPVAGHIPGARCLPHSGNLNSDGLFLEPQALAERFTDPEDAHSSAEMICYCGSGVTATHNILAMSVAGLPEPKLYVGSWSEWCADPARPIAPARATTD